MRLTVVSMLVLIPLLLASKENEKHEEQLRGAVELLHQDIAFHHGPGSRER